MVLQLNIGEAQERADGERLQVLMHISTLSSNQLCPWPDKDVGIKEYKV